MRIALQSGFVLLVGFQLATGVIAEGHTNERMEIRRKAASNNARWTLHCARGGNLSEMR